MNPVFYIHHSSFIILKFMFGGQKKLVMCQACRALIEPSAKACPLCGRESVPPLRAKVSEVAGSGSFFSLLILTINIGLFILMAVAELKNGGEVSALLNGPSRGVLIDFGGRWIPLIEGGQLWRMVTPIFIHLGVMHLMFNSLALYHIGPQAEEALGSQKFIFAYLATGIVGNIASFVFNIYGAGASGAIFGLIGIMAIYGYRMRSSFGRALMRQMLIWAGIGLIFGMVIGADNINHLGGLGTGAALGFMMKLEEPATRRAQLTWNSAAIACALLIAASIGFAALNYGKYDLQRSAPQPTGLIANISRLTENLGRMEEAFNKSFAWKSSADGDPKKIASDLRNAAASVDRVSSIDGTSDEIRQRLTALANRRADTFDQAEANPAAPIESSDADFKEAKIAFTDFYVWVSSLMQQRKGDPY